MNIPIISNRINRYVVCQSYTNEWATNAESVEVDCFLSKKKQKRITFFSETEKCTHTIIVLRRLYCVVPLKRRTKQSTESAVVEGNKDKTHHKYY